MLVAPRSAGQLAGVYARTPTISLNPFSHRHLNRSGSPRVCLRTQRTVANELEIYTLKRQTEPGRTTAEGHDWPRSILPD
jgi:hypothetical protein